MEMISWFEDGFSLKIKENFYKIYWDEIIEMNVYKADLMIYDCVCLEIITKNKMKYTVNEEIDGFETFLENIENKFPEIEKSWKVNVIHPPFKDNLTTIYKKN